MTSSLRVALAFLAVTIFVAIAAFVGVWPREPWDLYAFVVFAFVIPFVGLVATLACVARELPRPWGVSKAKATKPWQTLVAICLSLVHFLGGGALFLAPFSMH